MSRWSILAMSLSVGPLIGIAAYLRGVIVPKPGMTWVYCVGFPAAIVTCWLLAFFLRCKHRKALIFVTPQRAVRYCESCGNMEPTMHPLTRLMGNGKAAAVEKSQPDGAPKPTEAKP